MSPETNGRTLDQRVADVLQERHKRRWRLLGAWIVLFSLVTILNSCSTRDLVASNKRAIIAEKKRTNNEVAQLRYAAYIFCRSEGRSPKACKKISRAILLPSNIDIHKLKVDIAELGEAQVTRLLVGPKGKRGLVGPGGIGKNGKNGARGPRGLKGSFGPVGDKGATGSTGAQGAQGPKGDPGTRGATGPQGPQGPTGPQGPAGQICPGLHIVSITIPSSGTWKIPVCP